VSLPAPTTSRTPTPTPTEASLVFQQGPAEDAASGEANIWIGDNLDVPILAGLYDGKCSERVDDYTWNCSARLQFDPDEASRESCILRVQVHSDTNGFGWNGRTTDDSDCTG
jgi:hypothetical protein